MTEFDAFLTDFLLDAHERCDRAEGLFLEAVLREGPERDDAIDAARREIHTIKGNAGMVGMREVQTAAHRLEDKIASLQGDADALRAILSDVDELRAMLRLNVDTGQEAAGPSRSSQTLRGVRVAFESLDELVDLAAEMVVFRNRLDDAVLRARGEEETDHWQRVFEAHEALGKTLSFVQDRIMAIRMVPLRTLFAQLRRIVHDESEGARRQARFVAIGGDTPVDKSLLECASEALGHIVRNAVIHGIEGPDARRAAGKRAEGLVQLQAVQHSDEVWIEVSDDGAGIDRELLLRVAESRGIEASLENPLQLLFHDGFTTRLDADVSSGRGVGLSAAQASVRRIGGDIDVSSDPGRGTLFRLRLPLSVSVTRALLVRVDGDEYALPLSAIAESIRFSERDAHIINGSGVLSWRDRVVPILDLGVAMGSRCESIRSSGYIVVLEVDGKSRGIAVDDLTGIREIVVKQLDDFPGTRRGIAGATILGDGRVLLILDPKGLALMSPRVISQQVEEFV
jgi:two-component system, chemotaxis family, sensor kinase CheA